MRRIKSLLNCLLLVVATIACFAAPVVADTIVIGGGGIGQRFPFGLQVTPPPGPTAPNYQPGATYQQIYNGDGFGGMGAGSMALITQIAFASRTSGGVPGTANYDFTVRLGTSATPVGAVSSTYAANRTGDLTTVFSGALTATLTQTNNFDLIINFTTPFFYDPSRGDLLLDLTINQLTTFTGGNLFFDFGSSPDTSRVFNPVPSLTGTVNQTSGLRTRFTFTPILPGPSPVPEPATLILLGTGLAGVAAKVRRKRQSS